MTISVQKTISMDPQVIVIAGSNDHLQSRRLLSRLIDGSIPSNEVIEEARMISLSAMTEVEASVQRHFIKSVVKIIIVLSPGYATLPECHPGIQVLQHNSVGAGWCSGVGAVQLRQVSEVEARGR